VKDIPLFRRETFAANIGEKRDGVNGVNPVFFSYSATGFPIRHEISDDNGKRKAPVPPGLF